MGTKVSKHNEKYVKMVTENIIQYLLEGFLTKTLTESVVKVTSSKDESAACQKCDKKFISIPGLKTHMTRMHGEKTELKESWFSCDQCEGRFKLEGALNNHIKEKHDKEKKEDVDEDMEEENMKRNHSESPKASRKKNKIDDEPEKLKKRDIEEDLALVKNEVKLLKKERVLKEKDFKKKNDEI